MSRSQESAKLKKLIISAWNPGGMSLPGLSFCGNRGLSSIIYAKKLWKGSAIYAYADMPETLSR